MILVSEVFTGIIGGLLHNRFGNVNKRVWLVATLFAVLGSLLGTTTALSIPGWALRSYIGILVLAMGVLMLWKHLRRAFSREFTTRSSIGISLLVGFNKAMSGGGFGPVLTSGLSLLGLNPKVAVGSTIMSEGAVCIFALMARRSAVQGVNWRMAIPLISGAVLSCLPAAYTTKKISDKRVGALIGAFTASLGMITLLKVIL